jgi:hypothetical protein
MEGAELSKIVLTAGMHQEIPLNTDFGINIERKDCKIGMAGGTCGRGRGVGEVR